MPNPKKFSIFFKINLKKEQLNETLQEFLSYLKKEQNYPLFGLSNASKSYKGTWKITITARPQDINYICRKFIDFLNEKDCLDTNAKVIYVSTPS